MSARDLPDDHARAIEILGRMKARYFAPPPRVDTAEWAAKYRYIAKGSERGQWRNERTPYLVEPMTCVSAFSPYERIVLMFATQLGKTEVLYNAIMQRIHTDPQDMMMVQPTLQDAQDHSGQRFLPTIMQTPIMAGLVAVQRSRDESSSWRARSIQGGFAVFFGGANSASSLASKPLGFAAADEVDKWPADVDNQGPPLGLLDERMSNFSRRKLVIASTPTVKGFSVIETEYLASDMRRYHVPCPHCGERQVLIWGAQSEFGLRWLKTASGEPRPETAVYICCKCGSAIEEHHKTAMLAEGIWIPENPGAGRGRRAGFTLNKLYSPMGWRSWASLVEKWDAAQKALKLGNSSPLKEFKNSSLAETFEEEGTGADSDSLRRRAEEYTTGIVPMRGLMLTMGTDTQPDRLEARVWAFGRGEESWLVERHIIYGDPNIDEGVEGSPWTRLSEIRRTPIMHASGAQMLIEATCVDSGGHNTHAVYSYCRNHAHANVLAIKGASQAGRPVLDKPKPMDVNWRGKTIPRGVKLWQVGTDTAKHLLYGRMRLTVAGPGFVHVPKAYAQTDEFEQMTAARLLPTVVQGKRFMRWITPQGKREEAGDCHVYAYAAACYLGIQTFREPSWAKREQRYCPSEPDLFGVQTSAPSALAPATPAASPIVPRGGGMGKISLTGTRRGS
ncbi:phage terminase large subunit family protein [Variovorax sp. V15]|uniref:phage terminase large subunit family protein n=1 Tax=Variovorax sp. V15 TaxID=3065952 RepID=UPI0034E841B6